MPVTAPDSGYAPTTVDVLVQGVAPDDADGDIARLTVPYGGRLYTDQFVADIQAAMTTAMLAVFPGGSIVTSTVTYTGQATVSTLPDPDPDA